MSDWSAKHKSRKSLWSDEKHWEEKRTDKKRKVRKKERKKERKKLNEENEETDVKKRKRGINI